MIHGDNAVILSHDAAGSLPTGLLRTLNWNVVRCSSIDDGLIEHRMGTRMRRSTGTHHEVILRAAFLNWTRIRGHLHSIKLDANLSLT